MGYLDAPSPRQIAVIVEFFLQLQGLVPGVGLASPLSVCPCASHPGIDPEVALALQIGIPLIRFATPLLRGISRAHHREVLLERRTVHVEGAAV